MKKTSRIQWFVHVNLQTLAAWLIFRTVNHLVSNSGKTGGSDGRSREKERGRERGE